jgi:hypothetical protein
LCAPPWRGAHGAADVRGTADEAVWETMLTVPVRDPIDE